MAANSLDAQGVADFLFSEDCCAMELRDGPAGEGERKDWRKAAAKRDWQKKRYDYNRSMEVARTALRSNKGYGIHPAPDIFVVDVDSNEALLRLQGDPRLGILFPGINENLAQLVTITHKGTHWWFRLPGGVRPTGWKQINSKSAHSILLGPNVDTRIGPEIDSEGEVSSIRGAGGGYVIAPGSYLAEIEFFPEGVYRPVGDLAIPDWPEELFQELLTTRSVKAQRSSPKGDSRQRAARRKDFMSACLGLAMKVEEHAEYRRQVPILDADLTAQSGEAETLLAARGEDDFEGMVDWAWRYVEREREVFQSFGEADPLSHPVDGNTADLLLRKELGDATVKTDSGRVLRFVGLPGQEEAENPEGEWQERNIAELRATCKRRLEAYQKGRGDMMSSLDQNGKKKDYERLHENYITGGVKMYLDWTENIQRSRSSILDGSGVFETDSHSGLVPFKDGTVLDFNDGGVVRQARRDDFIARTLPHNLGSGEHPVFDDFIQNFCRMGPDGERDEDTENAILDLLASLFLRRNSKHIWMFTGGTNNGKSLLFNIIAMLFGEELTGDLIDEWSKEGSHPSWMMELQGKSVALVDEGTDSRRMNISSGALRRLSHGEGGRLTARHIRGRQVKFKATHTLLIAFNQPPVIDSMEAMRSRITAMRCRYQVDIDGNRPDLPKADPLLLVKITEEAPAILGTLVERARPMWEERRRIDSSRLTVDSTQLWPEMNQFADFFEEMYELHEGSMTDVGNVRRDFREYIYINHSANPSHDIQSLEKYVPTIQNLASKLKHYDGRIKVGNRKQRRVEGIREWYYPVAGIRKKTETMPEEGATYTLDQALAIGQKSVEEEDEVPF